MFQRPRNWINQALWKPRNPHSLEHLKFLYGVLAKNAVVTEQNRSLLVETLRSISEILIWGDQNDSSVFDFFLEKNMLLFFLRILRQKTGRYVCVQLLQTLNILFENIQNETSLYYLLSNNHVNSIIVHKFDFSDEEVLAYYISFIKTLSLKLNSHTIHFFYNEHTNDFPLYTEAIKFFNHSESMVRIAVRTLTLNVYKVDDKSMLQFIRAKTAAPYFSNLVWFIGNHILELDNCVKNDADHQSRGRLGDLVAEHLDHLHYLNDILCLNIKDLNDVLTDHLLNRLFIPLYVYSLSHDGTEEVRYQQDGRSRVSPVVSLFLLSQVFLIIQHAPLVNSLADFVFNQGPQGEALEEEQATNSHQDPSSGNPRRFFPPAETLEKSLEASIGRGKKKQKKQPNSRNTEPGEDEQTEYTEGNSTFYKDSGEFPDTGAEDLSLRSVKTSDRSRAPLVGPAHWLMGPIDGQAPSDYTLMYRRSSTESQMQGTSVRRSKPTALPGDTVISSQNITDEEKCSRAAATGVRQTETTTGFKRRYLDAIFDTLDCGNNDYEALFSLCLLYAMGKNEGIREGLMDAVAMPSVHSPTKQHYSSPLLERLLKVLELSTKQVSAVRVATLWLSCTLVKQLVLSRDQCYLQDRHVAYVEGVREAATLLLRMFYKGDEIFLDMFEDEFGKMKEKPLNVEYLTMDPSVLLPPTGTPLTGIEFDKRLPCGEVERARKAMRTFFLLRDLSLSLQLKVEDQLPLTKDSELIKENEKLDLNNSDLIACTVVTEDKQRVRRFLVIDVYQLILVEPDTKKLGWGVARFVGYLQDVEVTADKEDSRALHVQIHKPTSSVSVQASPSSYKPMPLLSAKFIFDDHIRCMAAKQRMTKGRSRARQAKMRLISKLLDMPAAVSPPSPTPPPHRTLQMGAMRMYTAHPSHQDPPPTMRKFGPVPGFAQRRASSQTSPSSRRSASPNKGRSSPKAQNRSLQHETSVEEAREAILAETAEAIPLQDLSKQGRSFPQESEKELSSTNLSPSLRPAKAPPASLLPRQDDDGDRPSYHESVKLTRPADPDRIRSISDTSSRQGRKETRSAEGDRRRSSSDGSGSRIKPTWHHGAHWYTGDTDDGDNGD
ncbi:PREDICTED: protein CLEC16A-like [Branchiostoma belcheri]|uniref:Protein CLEC16A-like n=1 Tax=Branchiostoma belcheri TaxID=7741 RepID=A0A6P4XSL5_BRABE|nr:PREDICTED: protein CLEC16A-like [Branchiostoma belcheri]